MGWRVERGWLVVAVCAHAGAVLAGCALARFGMLDSVCATDATCDDSNACTADTCTSEGTCRAAPIDGTSALVQQPYDCNKLVCSEGQSVVTPDDTDKPINPCIDASCSGGVLSQSNKPDGAECTVGAGSGVCEAGGCVVICDAMTAPAVCDDTEPCTIDSCDLVAGRCVHEPIDNAPPPGPDPAGNCKRRVCVAGVAQQLDDNLDTPDDGNDCTDDVCDMGAPGHVPRTEGSACGVNQGLVCNAFGVCVGCNSPANCTPAPFCIEVTCVASQCGTQPRMLGEIDPDQSGVPPCQIRECDGGGNSQVVNQQSGTMCDLGGGANTGQCDGMGACAVVCNLRPAPPGGTCPAVCNGGCSNAVCTINCVGQDACKDQARVCPAGFACSIVCNGQAACRNSPLTCPGYFACSLACDGQDSCNNADLSCSKSGVCSIACSSSNNVCKNAVQTCGDNECTATCAGASKPSTNCGSSCDCQPCP